MQEQGSVTATVFGSGKLRDLPPKPAAVVGGEVSATFQPAPKFRKRLSAETRIDLVITITDPGQKPDVITLPASVFDDHVNRDELASLVAALAQRASEQGTVGQLAWQEKAWRSQIGLTVARLRDLLPPIEKKTR